VRVLLILLIARKIISQYELYHKGMKGNPAGLKAYASCALTS
jgi:hypothetical protein